MSNEERTSQTPISDLRKSTHEHYNEAASSIHIYSSSIPNAIDFYFDHLEKKESESIPKRWTDEVMLAEWIHDTYEEIAIAEGWETQKDCRVLFDDLPEKNKAVMLKVAGRLLDNGITEPKDK